jgi:hypothetical protein
VDEASAPAGQRRPLRARTAASDPGQRRIRAGLGVRAARGITPTLGCGLSVHTDEQRLPTPGKRWRPSLRPRCSHRPPTAPRDPPTHSRPGRVRDNRPNGASWGHSAHVQSVAAGTWRWRRLALQVGSSGAQQADRHPVALVRHRISGRRPAGDWNVHSRTARGRSTVHPTAWSSLWLTTDLTQHLTQAQTARGLSRG